MLPEERQAVRRKRKNRPLRVRQVSLLPRPSGGQRHVFSGERLRACNQLQPHLQQDPERDGKLPLQSGRQRQHQWRLLARFGRPPLWHRHCPDVRAVVWSTAPQTEGEYAFLASYALFSPVFFMRQVSQKIVVWEEYESMRTLRWDLRAGDV